MKPESLKVKIFADGADRDGMLEMYKLTNDVLKKMKLVDHDLAAYSLDTVKMFHGDARDAGFTL